ncbi:metallophosphoesterase [Leptolyngbya sp. FACHB-1515]|uniref:metallophosphoesterase family protein n=1 Tax=Cyanophyceae TaxID=3028117 RepID=UPI003299DD2C
MRRIDRHSNGFLLFVTLFALTVLAIGRVVLSAVLRGEMAAILLTDPFLQWPTADSVQVVWFTEFEGRDHQVEFGDRFEQIAPAATIKLSRMREDGRSKIGAQTDENQLYQKPVSRNIWRHEATVSGISKRTPYRVVSVENGSRITSPEFSLVPTPTPGSELKILLTSDHQLMPLTPVNLQKVTETIDRIDAVFLAGDLVNIPDRASEWFDDNRGGAFFPSLQGRASYQHPKGGQYRGGKIIQNAPLFPAVGNHEVMGRFSTETGLNEQYNDPYPRSKVANFASLSPKELADRSFNTISVQELFNFPNSYYAISFGDVRLVSLFAANIWRTPDRNPSQRGRYQERKEDFNSPDQWGYGQHIFEPIAKGSPQYNWLQAELNSPEFQQAKYKIVMFHHPPHTLGDNIVPAYTNPVQIIDRSAGQIQDIRYEYPIEQDFLIRDVVPLLESAGVQLVFYGHSHLWNRFISSKGMHFLESSNVGNTYGAYLGEKRRPVPPGFKEKYVATGDPNGLEPVMPSIAPLTENGKPQPYIASNDITAFSIFDTATGTISSYRFDPNQPNSSVVKFDEFRLRT